MKMINPRLFEHYGIDTRKDLKMRTVCPRPFDTVLIDKRGSCYACECQSWLPQSIGNMQIQSLADIVDSATHRELQGAIRDGTYRYCNEHQCAWLLDKKNPPEWPNQAPHTRIQHLRLAIDDSCNLRCPSCRKGMTFHKEGAAYELGIRLADRINDWLHRNEHAVQVHIGSDGDPFASHVYRHFMSRTPARNNITYSLLTNGIMLPEFHEQVPHVMNGLRELGVSMDGATKNTYEKLRLGGRWDKITHALGEIKRLRGVYDFRFILHFVVQRDNYHEMSDMVALARRYGADRVWLNRITDWQTLDDFGQHDVANPRHPEHERFLREFDRIRTEDNFVEYATLEAGDA